LFKHDVITDVFRTWTDEQKAAGWATFQEGNGLPSSLSTFKEGYLQMAENVNVP